LVAGASEAKKKFSWRYVCIREIYATCVCMCVVCVTDDTHGRHIRTTHTDTHTHTPTHTHTCTHTCTHTPAHTHLHTHPHTHAHTHTQSHTHTCTRTLHKHTHTHTRTHNHTHTHPHTLTHTPSLHTPYTHTHTLHTHGRISVQDRICPSYTQVYGPSYVPLFRLRSLQFCLVHLYRL
jgi:hypothetical protein